MALQGLINMVKVELLEIQYPVVIGTSTGSTSVHRHWQNAGNSLSFLLCFVCQTMLNESIKGCERMT